MTLVLESSRRTLALTRLPSFVTMTVEIFTMILIELAGQLARALERHSCRSVYIPLAVRAAAEQWPV